MSSTPSNPQKPLPPQVSPPRSIPANTPESVTNNLVPASTSGTVASPATSREKPQRNPLLIVFVLALLVIFAGIVYEFGVSPRLKAKVAVDEEQKLSTERTVIYALTKLASPKTELTIPGTVEAFQQASIYARTNGYVKKWLVDIGQVVHEGDLLAELDTPEIDQQLSEAKATAEKSKASLDIAQSSADRWNGMVAARAVSQQEADEKNAARNEAKATLDADLAAVARLTEQQNFKEIRAPFNGTITKRDIEIGNLVSSGNGTGTHELFRIAQTDPLRVFLEVPEANTPSIHPGVKAYLHVRSYPDRVFEGDVVRSAGAIDDASRTLRTEVDVANPDGLLLPGTYADVRLELSDLGTTILIPANTLIVNASGTQVARLDDVNDPKAPDQFKVSLLPVRVGRDFGTEVEILQTLRDGDRLVANPPADLTDGSTVTGKPLPPKPKPQAPPDAITASPIAPKS